MPPKTLLSCRSVTHSLTSTRLILYSVPPSPSGRNLPHPRPYFTYQQKWTSRPYYPSVNMITLFFLSFSRPVNRKRMENTPKCKVTPVLMGPAPRNRSLLLGPPGSGHHIAALVVETPKQKFDVCSLPLACKEACGSGFPGCGGEGGPHAQLTPEIPGMRYIDRAGRSWVCSQRLCGGSKGNSWPGRLQTAVPWTPCVSTARYLISLIQARCHARKRHHGFHTRMASKGPRSTGTGRGFEDKKQNPPARLVDIYVSYFPHGPRSGLFLLSREQSFCSILFLSR